MVVFGGMPYTRSEWLNETAVLTWSSQGNTWQWLRDTQGSPKSGATTAAGLEIVGSVPSARAHHSLCAIAKHADEDVTDNNNNNNTALLFGGFDGTMDLNDLHEIRVRLQDAG